MNLEEQKQRQWGVSLWLARFVDNAKVSVEVFAVCLKEPRLSDIRATSYVHFLIFLSLFPANKLAAGWWAGGQRNSD